MARKSNEAETLKRIQAYLQTIRKVAPDNPGVYCKSIIEICTTTGISKATAYRHLTKAEKARVYGLAQIKGLWYYDEAIELEARKQIDPFSAEGVTDETLKQTLQLERERMKLEIVRQEVEGMGLGTLTWYEKRIIENLREAIRKEYGGKEDTVESNMKTAADYGTKEAISASLRQVTDNGYKLRVAFALGLMPAHDTLMSGGNE